MQQYYTYIYQDPSKNMEPVYIGKGFGLRVYEHLTRTDHHPLTYRLQKMLREGIQPEIGIISVSSEYFAFELEKGLIKQFGRKDLGTGTLLNLTNGGEGTSGYNHTKQTKERMSKSNKGKLDGRRNSPDTEIKKGQH